MTDEENDNIMEGRIPTILTLRDVFLMMTAVVSVMVAWGMFGTRLSVVEEKMLSVKIDVRELRQIIKDVRHENKQAAHENQSAVTKDLEHVEGSLRRVEQNYRRLENMLRDSK